MEGNFIFPLKLWDHSSARQYLFCMHDVLTAELQCIETIYKVMKIYFLVIQG